MANYTAADVKRLRELTGAGMLDCKNALAESDGDFDKAVEALRIKGAKDVGKRAERATAEGLVAAKGGGAMIELNSETDFVAKKTPSSRNWPTTWSLPRPSPRPPMWRPSRPPKKSVTGPSRKPSRNSLPRSARSSNCAVRRTLTATSRPTCTSVPPTCARGGCAGRVHRR